MSTFPITISLKIIEIIDSYDEKRNNMSNPLDAREYVTLVTKKGSYQIENEETRIPTSEHSSSVKFSIDQWVIPSSDYNAVITFVHKFKGDEHGVLPPLDLDKIGFSTSTQDIIFNIDKIPKGAKNPYYASFNVFFCIVTVKNEILKFYYCKLDPKLQVTQGTDGREIIISI